MPLAPFFILGAFALVALAMHLRLRRQGYRPGAVPARRAVAYEFDPPNSVTLTGGARIGGFNASVPLVALTADHAWARLQVKNLFRVAPVWIERAEVVAVRTIGGTLGNGIMFDTADGHLDGIIFWTFEAEVVLRAFEWYRWPVVRPDRPSPDEGQATTV